MKEEKYEGHPLELPLNEILKMREGYGRKREEYGRRRRVLTNEYMSETSSKCAYNECTEGEKEEVEVSIVS